MARSRSADDRPDRYDRDYFDRWYRAEGFGSPAHLARKVGLAVGAAEYLLGRPVRSVLDVGCGEGAWQPALSRLRPRARYVGVDPSAYVVERYGRRRNLRRGGLGDLDAVVPVAEGPFDLIVCVDVLGYAADAEARSGLGAMAARLGGVAFVEAYTSADEIVGDIDRYRRRRTATYERWFAEAGLARVGPHLYAGAALRPFLTALEGPLGPE